MLTFTMVEALGSEFIEIVYFLKWRLDDTCDVGDTVHCGGSDSSIVTMNSVMFGSWYQNTMFFL